jgi:hypothetical protein
LPLRENSGNNLPIKKGLGNKTGTLSPERVTEVLDGIKLILESRNINARGFFKGLDTGAEEEDDTY